MSSNAKNLADNLQQLIAVRGSAIQHKTFYDVIKAYSKEGDGPSCAYWVEKMGNMMVSPGQGAFNMVITAFAKNGRHFLYVLKCFDILTLNLRAIWRIGSVV